MKLVDFVEYQLMILYIRVILFSVEGRLFFLV